MNVKITVIRKADYKDLSEKYENKIDEPCSLNEGEVFVTDGYTMPDGFCPSAWQSIYPFAFALANNGENLYDGWMKNKKSAMVSCNDGFRPVSFLLEAEKNYNYKISEKEIMD